MSFGIWKNRLARLGIAMSVTVVAAAFVFNHLGADPERKPTQFEPEFLQNGTEVIVRSFRIGRDSSSNNAESEFTGTIQPRYQTAVGFRVAGKIESRHVDVGSRVKKGDLLFQLDPTDFDLQLRVAEADLVSAQSLVKQVVAEEKRLNQLRSSGSVSQSEYDLALANRDVAMARVDSAVKRLELARNQREYCVLRSDFDGLVTSIRGEAGQVVNIAEPILQMMQGEILEAVVSLPENRVVDARETESTVTFWSRPEICLKACLRELSPVADPVSRTYDARFQLLDIPKDIAIGMTATVRLRTPRRLGRRIPLTAVGHQEGQAIVWRILESTGRVEALPVEVLSYDDEFATVRGSLNDGDAIVSAGVQRMDSKVRVHLWNEPSR